MASTLDHAGEEHIRDLLKSASVARDLLPYTEEFQNLKTAFEERTFIKLSDAEFWTALVNVAKKGGIAGKASVVHHNY